MATVELTSVSKTFPDGTHAVRSLNLTVDEGEFVTLVGPSGCGKTTALRMIAGLEEVSDGTIAINGTPVTHLDPRQRDIAMVFQNYALYPHMSVQDNVGFPLWLARVKKPERGSRIRSVARTLALEGYLNRRPGQLSGGQRQRVAMGRAIIREPRVFLMDEPLSNLDAKLRVQMRAEIASLQRDLGVTTIYVTHDQVEALTMGQRIAVMRKGELQQYGPPSDIYDHPTNLFVAGFIGSPPMNLREATLKERDGGQLELELGATHLALDDDETQRVRPSLPELLDRKVVVGIRPEHFEQAPPERRQSNGRVLAATVRLKEALGSDAYVHFALAGATDTLDNAVYRLIHDADDPTTLEERPQTQRATTFIGRFPPRTQAEPGSEFRVAVRPGAIRLFSATTGIAIS